MEVPFWTVDSFTRQPFSGNPAAVCLLEADLSDEEKQQIATEMNISETCYVTKVTADHLHCLLNDLNEGSGKIFLRKRHLRVEVVHSN